MCTSAGNSKGITLDADRLEVTSCGGFKTGGHVDWYSSWAVMQLNLHWKTHYN